MSHPYSKVTGTSHTAAVAVISQLPTGRRLATFMRVPQEKLIGARGGRVIACAWPGMV